MVPFWMTLLVNKFTNILSWMMDEFIHLPKTLPSLVNNL